MSALILLSKPDCHLCHEMKAVVSPILAELGLQLVERDVRADPEDRRRWALEIPVLLWNGTELARHRTTADEIRSRLAPLLRAEC